MLQQASEIAAMTHASEIKTRLETALKQRKLCDFSVGSEEDLLGKSDKWGEERTIAADALHTLLLDKDIAAGQPLEIKGARITGVLDLRGASLARPLQLVNCAITNVIWLEDASASTLILTQCKVAAIKGHRAQFDGSLLVRDCEFDGPLDIIGAVIKGDLDLKNSKFGPKAIISADRIRVDGAVYLREGFSAKAGVRLEGARVGLAFDGSKASFYREKGVALLLENADIGGYCVIADSSIATELAAGPNQIAMALGAEGLRVKHFLSMVRTSITGLARMRGAQIGANLNLDGMTVTYPGYVALDLERAKVTGDVFLRRHERKNGSPEKAPFTITGGFTMTSASIGGSLVIEGAVIQSDGEQKMLLNRMNVSGVFRFINTQVTTGLMSLANSKVFAMADDLTSWPKSGRLLLNGFDYGAFSGDAPTGWRERVDWVRRYQAAHFNPQPFTHLVTVLRRTGYERDARMVAIEREREARRRMRPFSAQWIRNVLMEATCGHGYRPWQAAAWGLAIILLGTIMFDNSDGEFAPTKEAALAKYRTGGALPADYPPLIPFVYSADVFLPIVNLQQKEFWAPDPGTDGGYAAWIYRPIHIIAGWFFTTIFVAGVSGLIRKD
jgi:hypothetical protein